MQYEPDLAVICWDIDSLRTVSKPLKGPLPIEYIKAISDLCDRNHGIYLSGVQIGDARRFAVPCKISPCDYPSESGSQHYENGKLIGFPVLYNPEIIDQYDKIKSEEGCLSFPGINVRGIPRFKYVEFTYRDQNWDEMRVVVSHDNEFLFDGPLAIAVQHEVDHMNGDLFLDRVDKKQKFKVMAAAHVEFRKLSGKRTMIHTGPLELEINK